MKLDLPLSGVGPFGTSSKGVRGLEVDLDPFPPEEFPQLFININYQYIV